MATLAGPGSRRGQAALYHARQRRRHADRRTKFAGDIASPHDLGTVAATNPSSSPYPMPAAARMAVSFSTAVTAGQLTIAASGRTYGTPALDADELHRLDFLERDETLAPTSAIAGTVTLHVLDEWGRATAVATGEFT